MSIDEIPLPPEAKTGTINGSYEVALDNATNLILTELKKNYPKTQEKILFLPAETDAAFLPAETDAAKVFEFYAPKMTEKGFSNDQAVPLQSRNYQQNVWKKGDQAISIAVIEAGTDAAGKGIKFLVLHTGEK